MRTNMYIIFLIYASIFGTQCFQNLPIPLMDKLQAPIVANLDMSKFNQQLEAYIDGAIQQAIEEAHETLNGRIEKLVNKLNYLNESTASNVMVTKFNNELLSSMNLLKTSQGAISSKVDGALKRVSHNEEKVGFTACVDKGDDSDVSGGDPIPFTKSRSAYGVDISAVKTSGKFTCNNTGLYHISASIRSKTNHGFYGIHQNDYTITFGYTADHDGVDTYVHSGTIECVRELKDGDVITVKPWRDMQIDAWSCLTIVKLK